MRQMKRPGQLLPLPVLQMRGGAHQPLFSKGNVTDENWYRIENKKGSGPAKIYIYNEIGFWGTTAADFIKELEDVTTDKIDLHLNSPGGAIFDGIAIYNSLKMHDAEVTVYIDALAASAASFIAQAGDKIIMARNGTMMIHDGVGMVFGNAKDMRETALLLDRMSNNIADIYAQRAGGSVEEWRGMMQAETWYTGQEAVDAHLADELNDTVADDGEDPTNKWDFSIFNYAGRSAAPSPQKIREQVITNRATEALVGKPTESTEGQPASTEAPSTPATPPEAVAPAVPAPPAPVVPPIAAVASETLGVPATSTPSQTFEFKIGGQTVTDFAQVQAHIESLETFRNETRDNARKTFVANLARDTKILASQIPDLEKFVDTLSDDQYELWMASWGAATPVGVLQTPAVNQGEVPNSGSTPVNTDDEIAKYEGIVRQHKLGGMPSAAIMKTDSYARLIQLVPDYKLS